MYVITQIIQLPIILTIIVMVYLSIYDINFKEIPMVIVVLFIGFGFINQLLMVETISKLFFEIGGSIVGALILLLIGKITKEQVGYGDGYVFLMLGILNTWQMALTIYVMAFMVAGIVGLVLIVINRKRRGQSLAFIPFVTVTYLFLVFVR